MMSSDQSILSPCLANRPLSPPPRYVNEYLSIKNTSAEAYKLLGDVYEALNNADKSLESYKKSYYIDKSQDNLLFKICEKLETLDTADTHTVKTWLDRLEKKHPNHRSVFVLKDKLELENGNCSTRLEDTFRDLSNVRLSDLTDDKGANLSCSFLNARSPSLNANQFKSLERSQDRLFKKVVEIEEKFTKTTNEILDIVKENQTMFGQLKGEVDKLNTALGKLAIGQSEIKQSMDDYLAGNYEVEDEEDEEEDEDDEDADDGNENDPISSFLSCASNTPQQQQNLSGVHSRIGVSPKQQQASKSISFTQQTPQETVSKDMPFFSQENLQRQQQIHNQMHGLQIGNQPPMINQPPIGNQPMGILPPSLGFPASVLPSKDSWECQVCYVRNAPTDLRCKSCETPNGAAPAVIKSPLDQLSAAISKIGPANPTANLGSMVNTPANQNSQVPLSELFKNQYSNTWECKVCYIKNPLGIPRCPACETPNPAVSPVKDQTPAISKPPFTLETGPKGGFSFLQTFNQASSGSGASSTDNKFVFGVPASSSTTTSDPTKEPPKFTFNNSTPIFGQPQQSTPQVPAFGPPPSLSPAKQPQLTTNAPVAPPVAQFPPLASTGFVFGNQNAGSNLSLQTPVFGSLAGSSTTGGLFSPATSLTPTAVKDDKQPTSSRANESSSDHVDEEEPQFDFKPVIPLPPKVDVVTGEENEKVLFVNRAKLFRFTENEWKERGIGDIKILHHEQDNRYRLLMRRDQIHKVCLNAPIMPQFEFQAGRTNAAGTMISWGCVDFSEERSNPQIFALRFKSKEIVERFREEVMKVVAILNAKDAPTKEAPAKEAPAKEEPAKYDDLEVVYVKEPKSKEDREKAEKLKLPINFFNTENVKPCTGCNGCKEYIPKLRYEVEGQKENEEPETNTSNADNLFASAIADVGSSKSSWTKSTEQPNWMKSALTPIFSGQTSNRAAASDDPEAEIDTLDFKPLIPLPDLIEVKTGEEDEEVLFSSRAKLYKFSKPTNEWKERGLGEFKVLRHKQTKKIRFLMRREQVHKICLNHMVDKGLKIGLRTGRDTIYQWGATDFSESTAGDPSNFNIKFKTKELGRQLMAVLKEHVEGFVEEGQ